MSPSRRSALQRELGLLWEAGEPAEAIAAALRLNVRTVRRWRLELALPARASDVPREDPEDRLARLRELRAQGRSRDECAVALGVSHGTISGLLHRHRIPALRPTKAPEPKRPQVAVPKPRPLPPPVLPRAPVVAVRGCQYPIGQPARVGFYFCGKPVVTGAPYCRECRDLCWQRPPRREAAA